MAPPPELPAHICQNCDQVVRSAVRDLEVYADNARLEERVQALRRYFDEALARELAKRNDDQLRKDSRALPPELLLVVMDYLQIVDVLGASRVCKTWRKVALAHPTLWTQLTIRATLEIREDADIDDSDLVDDYEDCIIVSNARVVQEFLLPRSQMLPLSLIVEVDSPAVSRRFLRELRTFLERIALRLSALHIQTECTDVVAEIFYNNSQAFPELRELTLSMPGRSFLPTDYPVHLGRVRAPKLARLDLREGYQLVPPTDKSRLPVTFLHTRITKLRDVVPLLHAAPRLQHLECRAFFDALVLEDMTLSPAALDALYALQEVRFRTELRDGVAPDDLLAFFMRARCKRVVLEFECCTPATTFRPVLSGLWADATQIALRDAPDALDVVLAGDAGRTLTIRLLGRQTGAQRIDWERVPRLPALTALHVDATVWSIAMRHFPSTPQIADTTLAVGSTQSLDTLMCNGAGDPGCETRRMNMHGAHLPQAATGVEDAARDATPVPRGSSLTISSDVPVSIARWGLADVRKRLAVDRIALDGVLMKEHASMSGEDQTV